MEGVVAEAKEAPPSHVVDVFLPRLPLNSLPRTSSVSAIDVRWQDSFVSAGNVRLYSVAARYCTESQN